MEFVCFGEFGWSFFVSVSLSVRQSLILYVAVSKSMRQNGIVRFVLINSLKSGDS